MMGKELWVTPAVLCVTLAQARKLQIESNKYSNIFGSTDASGGLICCRPFHDRLDHLVAQPHGFWESWCEVLLNRLKAIAVSLEGTKRYTIGPRSSRERELQVIRTERMIFDGGVDNFIKETFIPKKVLCHTQPDPKQWSRADHVVVRDDSKLPPAVHNCE